MQTISNKSNFKEMNRNRYDCKVFHAEMSKVENLTRLDSFEKAN